MLRDGPDSPYARWFDVDRRAGDGRLLLPVLPARLPEVRDRFRVSGGTLRLDGQEFPLRPGTEGLPLDELLDAQWYRLGWWRLARTELNYRRFFTVSDLIGVRVEEPEVFEATHAKIVELVADGVVEGLRIDHPDGLADPQGYLEDLAEATGGRCWTVVEKILTGTEELPAAWPVAGTTGTTRCGGSTGCSPTPWAPTRSPSCTGGTSARPPTGAAAGRRPSGAPRTRWSGTTWPPRRPR